MSGIFHLSGWHLPIEYSKQRKVHRGNIKQGWKKYEFLSSSIIEWDHFTKSNKYFFDFYLNRCCPYRTTVRIICPININHLVEQKRHKIVSIKVCNNIWITSEQQVVMSITQKKFGSYQFQFCCCLDCKWF